MKITETVDLVKRNKLPRDPVWLRNRIEHLMSVIKFHIHQFAELTDKFPPPGVGTLGPSDHGWLRIPSPALPHYNVLLTSQSPVFTDPIFRATVRNFDSGLLPLRNFWIDSKGQKYNRMIYHLTVYKTAKEDLERTVRSAMRMKV